MPIQSFLQPLFKLIATHAHMLEENIAANIEHFHKYPKKQATEIKI